METLMAIPMAALGELRVLLARFWADSLSMETLMATRTVAPAAPAVLLARYLAAHFRPATSHTISLAVGIRLAVGTKLAVDTSPHLATAIQMLPTRPARLA